MIEPMNTKLMIVGTGHSPLLPIQTLIQTSYDTRYPTLIHLISDHQLIKTEGLINSMKMTIILDPAADISLVPKEYVSTGKWADRRANVVLVQGPTIKRDTAIVDFEVQSCTLKRVMLVPRSELNSGTILSIDFTKADQRELMIKVAEDMEEKEKRLYVRLKLGHRLEREKRKKNRRLQELQGNPTTHNLDYN